MGGRVAGFPFRSRDKRRIERILNVKLSGENYSKIVWWNNEKLAAAVKREVMLGIRAGRSLHNSATDIDAEFAKGYGNARRLIRTETAYVANQAQTEAYKARGVERYIYVAIIDLRTSEL